MNKKGRKIIIFLLFGLVLVGLISYFLLFEKNIDNKRNDLKVKETIKDKEKPIIKLNGADEIRLVVGSEYIEKGATATDNIDGDISSNIKIKGRVNSNKPGEYIIIYNITDSSKNKSEIKRTINVINVDKKDENGISVLMYHYFYDDENGESGENSNYLAKSKFEEQLKYLKENDYYFPTMKELNDYLDRKIELPEKSVIITMDDGEKSNYSIAYPLALKYKIPMVMFIVTSWTNPNDDTQKSMINSGYMVMQSHSNDMHKSGCSGSGHGGIMQCIDYNEGVEDLKKSKEIIGNGDSFAYPCGDYNDQTIKMLADAGFNLAFTTTYGRVTRGLNKLALPRVRINSAISLEQFKKSL